MPKQYKATLRIPTDQYAYIEVGVEGTAAEIINAYLEFAHKWNNMKDEEPPFENKPSVYKPK